MTLEELQAEMESIDLPSGNFNMSPWETVVDAQEFLTSHYSSCQSRGEKYMNSPEWERLLRFYEAVKNKPEVS